MRRRQRPVDPAVRANAPLELLDPDAEVWRDRDRFLAYLAERGWPVPARDRLRVVHPELAGRGSTAPGAAPVMARYRRMHAAGQWAREHGLALNGSGQPDWDALRMLLDSPALRSAARRAGRRKETVA